MKYAVRVRGSDAAFTCEEGQDVLSAALAAGWELPYSCRRGACESCRARVVSGEFVGPTAFGGDALLCQAHPRSDLEIAPREIRRLDPNARRRIDAKLYRVERPAPDVAVVHLRFPAGVRAKFRAGQYLEVILDDGGRRAFSMANPPHQSDGATLHVRVLPGGSFSERFLNEAGPGSIVPVEIPFGDFHLRESDKPAVLVAGGTGFAPMKSIVEDALKRGLERELHLYWGVRRRADLYAPDLLEKWAHLKVVPVLSEEAWEGRQGLVHMAVLADFPSLAGVEAYVCGAPPMVDAARRDFASAGLPAEAFFSDPFAPTG